MPTIPQAGTETLEYTDRDGELIQLTVKERWDAGAQDAMHGYFTQIALGETPQYGPKLTIAKHVIVDWNYTNPDGSKAPITYEALSRLEEGLIDMVDQHFERLQRAEAPKAPLAGQTNGNKPESLPTGASSRAARRRSAQKTDAS